MYTCYAGLWVHGIYVNPSIVDEGAIAKQGPSNTSWLWNGSSEMFIVPTKGGGGEREIMIREGLNDDLYHTTQWLLLLAKLTSESMLKTPN